MDQNQTELARDATATESSPLWWELLKSALEGVYPSDAHLESILDTLERTP